jgi:hypothetical protein
MPTQRLPVIHPVQLSGAANPLSQISIVSNRITFRYVLDSLRVLFPPGTDRLVLAYIFVSLDPTVHTASLPLGFNVLSPISPLPYLLGDAQEVDVPLDYNITERGTYLKLHIVNNDGNPHTINAVLSLRQLEED